MNTHFKKTWQQARTGLSTRAIKALTGLHRHNSKVRTPISDDDLLPEKVGAVLGSVGDPWLILSFRKGCGEKTAAEILTWAGLTKFIPKGAK